MTEDRQYITTYYNKYEWVNAIIEKKRNSFFPTPSHKKAEVCV